MADPVKSVDTKAQAYRHRSRDVKLGNGQDAADVFVRRPEVALIDTHQTVRTTIGQNDSIETLLRIMLY